MRAIIVDMDGTLCDVSSIRHYVEGKSKNFHAFHEASRFCPTHPSVERAVRRVADAGTAVVIVTARDARHEQATRDFLARNHIPFDALFMRPWGDQRRDTVVKNEIFDRIIAAGFDPVIAIDDREDVADVWRSRGVPVFVVNAEGVIV